MKRGRVPLDRDADYVGVSVAASGNTTIFQVGADAMSRAKNLLFSIENAGGGGVALDACQLEIKVHKDAAWAVAYSSAADWDSPAGYLDWVVGSPEDLADAAAAVIALSECDFYDLRIRASAAAGGTTVNAYGSMLEWA